MSVGKHQRKPKRVVLGEGFPGKAVECRMYLYSECEGKQHLVPMRSFRDLWGKKIRLIAEILDEK